MTNKGVLFSEYFWNGTVPSLNIYLVCLSRRCLVKFKIKNPEINENDNTVVDKECHEK